MRLHQRRVCFLALLAIVLLIGVATWSVLRAEPGPVLVNIGSAAQFPPGSVTFVQLDASLFDATHLPNGDSVDLSGLQFPQRTWEAVKMQWNRRGQPAVGEVAP